MSVLPPELLLRKGQCHSLCHFPILLFSLFFCYSVILYYDNYFLTLDCPKLDFGPKLCGLCRMNKH